MVVLGIDPGLASTGYGVVESRRGALAVAMCHANRAPLVSALVQAAG